MKKLSSRAISSVFRWFVVVSVIVGCGGGVGFDTGDIDISPASAILVWGQAKTFSASLPSFGADDFNWTITNAAGTVVKKSTDKARFYAGLTLGGYNLEASLASDPTIKGRARVQIVDIRWLLNFGVLFGGQDSHVVSSDLDIAAGSIFLAYNNNNTGNQVIRFNSSGVEQDSVGLGTDAAKQIVANSAGETYVSTDSGTLRKFDANLDELSAPNWDPPAESFAGPIALDASGNLYAINFSAQIVVMTPAGSEITRIDIPINLGTRSMIRDDEGNFYLLRATTITKLLANGTADPSFSINGGSITSGDDIEIDANNGVYVVDDNAAIHLLNGVGTFIVNDVSAGSPVDQPGSVAVSPTGELWAFDDIAEADFIGNAARLVRLAVQP